MSDLLMYVYAHTYMYLIDYMYSGSSAVHTFVLLLQIIVTPGRALK